ncbi:Pyrophosphate--fructose 6-phosphate 1-phosphotransferase subunit alpha [Dendrobium catenatum]|uniref:Pyrophosphate--fructose 6-phosphate 1-phosphotransferase subunit alpha n=1 Tax=Dendrobium catenatum TaxID=906689 RepID=A0A2I0VJ05_9ASPA|nr:Pyrophosphate--fructose 6-phosphate 1-phosphotransferase subunit alpha [Dendrobium catenatum]
MESDYGVARELSALQKKRTQYQPELPPCLQGTTVRAEYGDGTTTADPSSSHVISHAFPYTYGQPLAHFLRPSTKVSDAQIITDHPVIRVGVVFCGRQSPGGHNVIWGLLSAVKSHNPGSILLGFLGGTEGLFAQKTMEITYDILSSFKNQESTFVALEGGFDLLGRTQDQIRTSEQVNAAKAACEALKLNGLVVGVPVTLNGDLRNQFVETDVGFDTICRVNSQLISNICLDALSAEKYYYFIRLMGHKASHVAVECALQSHPNMVVFLAEEVAMSKFNLFDITKQISDAVQARAEQGKYHGVILIPEGLVESIPELFALLQEIHGLQSQGVDMESISTHLSPWASALFEFLPPFIRKQFLLPPESDNSAQFSEIEIEKLLARLVDAEMNKRMVLGHICYHILAAGLNGYMATVTNLKHSVDKWRCGAAPITAMMTVKQYSGGPGAIPIRKPELHPTQVDLKGKVYEILRQNAYSFLMEDLYRNPGPLQFEGPGTDVKSYTLCVEDQDYMGRIKKLQNYLDKVRCIVKPGCSPEILKAALSSMASVTEVLTVMSTPKSNGHILL